MYIFQIMYNQNPDLQLTHVWKWQPKFPKHYLDFHFWEYLEKSQHQCASKFQQVRSIFGTSEREMKTQIWAIVLLFLTSDGVTRPKETCWSIPRNQITQINKDLIFSILQSSTETTKIPHFIFYFLFSYSLVSLICANLTERAPHHHN